MDKILLPFRQGRLLNTLFVGNLIISFHYALVIYINSSFLSNFFSEGQVSALYIIGAILDTVLLLNSSKILQKIGSYRFIIYMITLELLSTVGLLLAANAFLVSLCFLVHVFSISQILFNMDILVESFSKDESKTGSIRATYLTLTSAAIVIAPATLSVLVSDNNYSYVYFLSSLFLIPLYYLFRNFKNTGTKEFKHIIIKDTVLEYLKNKNLTGVLISNFLLQFFYGFMVIYMPIYLQKYIGFSWGEIGIIFTIMLLPFVLFEIPVGELEDYKYGEKEFLTIGFVILALSTAFMSFLTVKIFWMWASILFISRIGASLVEISSESYFFKQVNDERTDIIGFFRVVRPVSFIVAPIVATISLQLIPFQYIFIVFGAVLMVGTKYALSLEDTR
ncbi:MAG TPA: MFS transporter [Candidatus Paceibacterota bacterium]